MSGKVAAAAASGIPASARKMVQSLKEIVNCPEAEIYATLKECDMDPDAAVNRLLTQDTFREVKSKRDKKKETKETGESRPRAVNNTSTRGSRVSSDRGPRSGYYQSSSNGKNDNQASRAKAAPVKENDNNSHHTSSILGPATGASNAHQKPAVPSSVLNTTVQTPSGLNDGPPLSTHPAPSGFQSAWSGGLHGHLSMADVVKMGRPQAKSSAHVAPIVSTDRSYAAQYPAMPSSHASKIGPSVAPDTAQSHPQLQPQPQPPVTQVTVTDPSPISTSTETNDNGAHDSSMADDWNIVDEPPAVSADYSAGASSLEGDVDKQYIQVVASDVQVQVEDSGIDAELDDALNNASAYQSQEHSFEHHEGEEAQEDAVASAAVNFQQLNLHEEEPHNNAQGENPAVIIPNHLQVSNADCAHLSFGSFSSGAFSGIFQQKALEAHPEVAPTVEETSTVDQPDNRDEEYYNNGTLKPSPTEDTGARMGTRVETLDMPSVSASEADVLRNEAPDAVHGLQYNMPSVSSHGFPSVAQPSGVEFGYPQGNTQLQNLSAFSSLLQANSLHGSLLAPTAQPSRDFDLSFSQLVTSQSMPTKYVASVPSTSGSTISVQEAAKQGIFSNQQPTAQSQNQSQSQTQTLASTNVPTGPPLPQPLAVHPYSQPTLPLGPFANLIGYPFPLPQNYYLPSAFQQPYTGNGAFHQSAAAVPNAGLKYTTLPQYKSSVSSSTSMPQASSVVSGYGAFGGSSSVPGNFAAIPVSGSGASTSLGFDEALSSQYKDMSHYMSLQQSENPAMYLPGAAGSRTLSTMPASNFYGYQGQTQHGGFRQGQQPSQINSLGYANYYHSQIPTGAQDHHHHHQQNPGDASLSGGAQAATQQPSHQLWQNSY
ncbi:RNA polymerase II degradation factor-like protein (DUF1296) [Rhynchospora pubera]|uniref:RNA polymerase II degradation factor-like protein (DUF1296) n=1 Tax=Rhynchospora pubera TaxID=906938 RepID=A0AAV8FXH5_9POAL|nr:RNA polymerase II degradation factor-like protein (DUF1296) [Rhynchospora pubera]